MRPYNFTLELAVRDYECDIQGIVNKVLYSTDNGVTWQTGSSGISRELSGVTFGE